MFQGTGSDVGKSLLTAGICRALANRGLAVRPFKPQNMSNNAAVAADGGEIGRAQYLQARAARAVACVDMNPVLLKPQSDRQSQIVVHGRVRGKLGARDFIAGRGRLMAPVMESYRRLAGDGDIIVVEGAGSPAEVNLRQNDIANMGFAREAGVPVVLIGDIDRGGVIASLVGTHVLLEPRDRGQIKGFVINKFRGDVSLFDGGLDAIGEHTGWPGLGVLPYLPVAARLPAEDAVALDRYSPRQGGDIRIAVPMLSRIANFDDFDPLKAEPDVAVIMVPPGSPLPGDADVVILPGSKAVIADLAFLRAQGWDIDLRAHVRRGGRVLGVCGGYQMLGRRIADPKGIEGDAREAEGLGLLDIETELTPAKTLEHITGVCARSGEPVSGYEMHMGTTRGGGRPRPMLRLDAANGADRDAGAVSPDGRIEGCYLHGLFVSDRFRRVWLGSLRQRRGSNLAYDQSIDEALDELAAECERHLDIGRMLEIAAGADGAS